VSHSNGSLSYSVDWSGVSGDHGLGGVSLNSGVMDVGGLHNLLDGVNLVRSGDWDSPGDGDLVRLGNMVVGDDLTGNSPGDSHGHINVVLVDLDLGDDVGDLGSDPDVAPHGGGDLGLGDSVSRSEASWDWCGGDGSIWSRSGRDGWRSNWSGLNNVLGSSGHVRGGWLGDGLLSGNDVLMTSNNTGVTGLDGPLSHNSVLHSVLHDWRSGSVAVVGLTDHGGGGGHWS